MRQFYCISVLCLVLLRPVSGFELSEQSRISILTVDPGKELYTIFGHTAIRVTDETLKIDRVYNFGTFDASSPFFYVEFIRGDINYFLSVTDYSVFFRNTTDERRRIVEQVLHLSYPERLKILIDLERQYQSSARFYRYDFFYDNCATRVRDVVFTVSPAKTKYDTSQFCCKSFRELLKPYIHRNYWLDLGVNLTLGTGANKTARSRDFMFLPGYIRNILNLTRVVEREQTLLEPPNPKSPKLNLSYLTPWIIVSLVLYAFFRSKFKQLILKALLVMFSTVGVILLLVTMISLNRTLSGNMNIWWTIPSLVLLLVKKEPTNYVFEIIYCTFLVLLIVAGWIILPGFSKTYLPWLITMAILLFGDIRTKRNIRLISAPIA